MADQTSSLSASVGLDTTDYKTAVSSLNREMRVVESGFKASAASLQDWGKDATGLEMRIEALNKTTDIQRQKVDAVRKEYERVRAEKGENARATQELEIKLNRETETLNKMERELGKTEESLGKMRGGADEAGDEVKDLDKKTEDATGSLGGLGKVASGLGSVLEVGVKAVAGLALAVAGVSGAIAKLVLDSAEAAGELGDLSAKTGIAKESLQEMDYASEMLGTSNDTISSSLARMIKTMGDAKEQGLDYASALSEAKQANRELDQAVAAGKLTTEEAASKMKNLNDIELGDYARAFDTLGVKITGANGELRDSEAVFYDVVEALSGVENATERDALAMDIFGRSAMELNPLIKAGSDEIARLREEAHEVGAVVDDDTIAALESFDDQIVSLKASLSGTAKTLAGAFLPGFSGIIEGAQGIRQETGGYCFRI